MKKLNFFFIKNTKTKPTIKMTNKFLTEKHDLKKGDKVLVRDRNYPKKIYKGVIHDILRKPENIYTKQFKFVDYFYIQFPEETYHQLIERGWDIIYKGESIITGDVNKDPVTRQITKIYQQYPSPSCRNETEINLHSINAILVWRIAFDIQRNSEISRL